MNISQLGLILGIAGASLATLDAWVRTRGIGVDSISIGHGASGGFWKICGPLGFALLVVGFVLQYIGSA